MNGGEHLHVWRIIKRKHLETAFSGIGGLYAEGRWTRQGILAVYTAESLALACLEVFVHTESSKIPLVALRAHLPRASVEAVDVEALPPDWQTAMAHRDLQAIGEDWFLSRRAPVLKVPSSIIPVEYNYILNPTHPDLRFTLDPPITFKFDERLWKPLKT